MNYVDTCRGRATELLHLLSEPEPGRWDMDAYWITNDRLDWEVLALAVEFGAVSPGDVEDDLGVTVQRASGRLRSLALRGLLQAVEGDAPVESPVFYDRPPRGKVYSLTPQSRHEGEAR